MATYGTTITFDDTRLPNDAVLAHSNKLAPGTHASNETAGVTQWTISPHADDSVGSQAVISFTLQIENSVYSFTIESVCNNKLENFVKVTYDETRFDLRIVPSADVIKTMAPMDVAITLLDK